MSTLTKDQKELVSLLRQVGYEPSPSTYTDINGLTGFDVSGGFRVVYSLNHQNSNVSLHVTLLSQTTKQPVRKLFVGLNYNMGCTFDYGTLPFIQFGGFDHDKSYVKVYKSEIFEEEVQKLVESMPKSHAKAFKIALNKIPLYSP